MNNLLEKLLEEKKKCRWRENTIGGDLCLSHEQNDCYFNSGNSYLIAEVEKSLEMTKLVMEIRGFPSVLSTTTLLIVS